MVILGISGQNAMQMGFIQHDDMVEALPAYRADDALAIWRLPGRTWCDGNFFDSHAFHAILEIVAVDAVAITNEKTRCLIERKGVDDLLGGPFGVRIRGDVEVNHFSPVVTEYDEDVENAKCDCGNGEKVAGRNVGNVIIQKSSPCLGRRFSRANHVLGHGCFGNVVAK